MVSIKQFKPKTKAKSRRGHDYARVKHEIPDVNRRLFKAYQTQAKPFWRRRIYYWLLIVPLLLVGIAIHLPVFSIKNVIINGAASTETSGRIKTLLNEAMAGRRWLLWPKSNIIFFDTNEARNIVGREFYSQDLFFEKHWPNVIKLNFRQTLISARWQSQDKIYAVDQRGIIIQELKEAQTSDQANFVLVKEAGDRELKLGDQVIDEAGISFINNFYKFWQENLTKVDLNYILMEPSSLPTIQAYTGEGWYVYVSVREDALTQINALKRLLSEKIKNDVANLLYVDVRFGSRLFFKLK
ncbi:MAG: cell division protein FtsQ/DivIB [Patescibacteria group bacterium]